MNADRIRARLSSIGQSQLLAGLLLLLLCAPLVLNYTTPIGNPDSGLYLAEGLNLAAKGQYSAVGSEPDILRPPLFTILVALAYKLLGVSAQSALLVVKLFGLVAVGFHYALGERYFGRYVGLIAAILIAASPYMTLYLFGVILLDGPQTAMFSIFLYFLLSGFQTGKKAHYVAAGIGLAAGFTIKESAILWVLLPVLSLLLVKEFRTLQSLRGLVVLYIPFALAGGAWWLYVYQVSGTIYLVGSGRTLILRDPSVLTSPPLLGGGLLMAAVLLAALVIAVRTHQFDKLKKRIPWQQVGLVVGWVLLLVYFGVAGSIPAADQYARYYELHIRSILSQNPIGYIIIPAWIVFAFVFRRSSAARVLLIFLALMAPLISILLVWQNQPRNLLALFTVSAVVVAAVVVTGLRYFVRIAAAFHPRAKLPATAAAVVLLSYSLFPLVQNSQIGLSLGTHYKEASVTITGANCARWLQEHAEPGSSIVMTALYDESLYFLMNGPQFYLHPLYPEFDSFDLTADGALFAAGNAFVARRPGVSSGEPPYLYLEEDTWLQSLMDSKADYYFFEGTGNVTVAPLAAQNYFNFHPGLELVCQARSARVITGLYKVDRAALRRLSITYLDSSTLGALEADAEMQPEPVERHKLYDAIGKQIYVASASDLDTAAAYKQIADAYWEAGRQQLALHYETRAAVLDQTVIDPVREKSLVSYWLGSQASNGWSAAALASYYAARKMRPEAEAAYSHAVSNLNQDYDLYSVLANQLAHVGSRPARYKLAEDALALWPGNNFTFASLMDLQLADNNVIAAQVTADKWLAIQNDQADTYQQISKKFTQAGEPRLAEATLRDAHRRLPSDSTIILALAGLYIAGSRYGEAAELLTANLSLENDQIYYQLVTVYLASGDVDAAERVSEAWQSMSAMKYKALLDLGMQRLQEAAIVSLEDQLSTR